jgi:heptosyltransferase III
VRILLIKPKHIGDTLLLTPTLAAIKRAHPAAEIWVMVRAGTEGILAGCPDIAQILSLPGVEKSDRKRGDLWHQARMLARLLSVNFDYVFELGDGHRARLFAMLARARRRVSVKTGSPLKLIESRLFTVSTFDWTTCHRVEKDYRTVGEFLPLPAEIPPLVYQPDRAQAWAPARDLTDFCVIQVGSRQGFARWNRDGWQGVGRGLLKMFAHVVLTCGPVAHEREDAAWLAQELGPRALSTDGRATWPEMAWLLARARLFVGPSTAAMHLAAAARCPVVALFGPTIEDHWHPWHVPYRIVTRPGYEPPVDPAQRYEAARNRSMDEIQCRQVIAACEELLAEVRAPRSSLE